MSRRIILLTMQRNRRSSSSSSSTNQQRTTMQLSSSGTIITRRRMKNNNSSSFRKPSNYLLLLLVLLLFKLSSVTSSFVLPKNTENDSLRTTTATTTNNNRIIRTIGSTTTITAKQQQHEQPEHEPTKLQEIWDRVYNTYVNRIRRNKTKDTTDSTPTTTTNSNKQTKKKESESYNDDTTTTISIPTIPEPIFPTLNRTMEMAKLSALVYKFHTEMNDTYICEELINNKLVFYNNTTEESYRIPTAWEDLYCYWYYHDRTTTGTQVLLVSSIQYNYIAIVFAGTDDTTTALTDIDILMKPYGPVDTTTTTTTKKEQQEKYGNNNDNTTVDPRYALYNNISLPPFSDPTTPTDNNNTTTSSSIKVHAGFNYALFHNNLMGEIITRVEDILLQLHDTSPTIRLLTTGHSLGGASAILTAVGLQLHFQQYYSSNYNNNNNNNNYRDVPLYNTTTNPITSITFGAPRMGNNAWYEYITTHESMRSVQLWRIVLGWDLVPRLPALMTHVGHTIQLQYITWYNNYTIIPSLTTTTTKERQEKDIIRKVEIDSCNGSMDCEYKAEQDEQIRLIQAYCNCTNNSNNNETTTTVATSWFGPDWWDDWDNYSSWWDDWGNYNSSSGNNNSTEYPQSIAYYNHYGNVTIGYAGVPFGWFTKSYLWVPGALWSHSVDRYLLFLQNIQQYDDNNDNNNNSTSTSRNQTTVTTSNNNETGSIWVHEFVRIDDNSTNKNITPTPPNNDDDWIHPLPNDDDIIHTE